MNFALAPKTRYRVVLVQPLLYLNYYNRYNYSFWNIFLDFIEIQDLAFY